MLVLDSKALLFGIGPRMEVLVFGFFRVAPGSGWFIDLARWVGCMSLHRGVDDVLIFCGSLSNFCCSGSGRDRM